jgi:hypothetical protein
MYNYWANDGSLMNLADMEIVTYAPDMDKSGHDALSRTAVTKRLAELLGAEFRGEYSGKAAKSANVYFVPQHTLLREQAEQLGIHGEDDLYGGVVPHPFVATKAITHSIVSEHARAPHGWSHDLGNTLADVVLPGYSAFTETDVVNAGRLMLRLGCVRIKPAHHLGGLGQRVVTNESELDAAVVALDKDDLHEHGVVLEQNLETPVTYSIGEIHLADRCIAYYGTQRTTINRDSEEVYGGSDLVIVPGRMVDLLDQPLTPSVRLAVTQAMQYDDAVANAFPEFFASRRNYDVVQGRDEQGRLISGVLEQSWRLGGASAAEIAGLSALAATPSLRIVRASTHEIYSQDEPLPKDADVYFDGADPHAGPLIKYCLVERHGS